MSFWLTNSYRENHEPSTSMLRISNTMICLYNPAWIINSSFRVGVVVREVEVEVEHMLLLESAESLGLLVTNLSISL